MSAFRLLNRYPEAGQLGGTRAGLVIRHLSGDGEGDRLRLGWDVGLWVRTGSGLVRAIHRLMAWPTFGPPVRLTVVVSQSPSSLT